MKVEDTKAYIYSNKVLSGEILAGKFILKSCERFMNDLHRNDLFFDLEEVDRVTYFFEKVIYVPELRKSVELPLPHAFWIQQLYGMKVKSTGLRKYVSVYMQVARKNFKTFYAAGITNFEAICGNDPNAEIMHGANSRDQALICTGMTGKLIKSSPEIKDLYTSDLIKIFTYKKITNRLVYEFGDRFCTVEAMPKDPGDGGNPSVGIVDEFHEAKDSSLLETIESGQGQRSEPLTIVITSPGHNKQGPCYQNLRKKSIDILNGMIEEDTHLAIIFELDNEDEWDKISMLQKSNPMIPYTSTLQPYLERRIKKAKDEGGEIAVNVKIKNSGIWVDAPKIWIASEIIRANNHGIKEEELKGKKCYAGLDLSAGKDLNAFVLFFPHARPNIHAVIARFWVPESKVVNQKEDGVDYRKWIDDKHITMFDGNVVEYSQIAEEMISLMENHNVEVIGADTKYLYTGPTGYLREGGWAEKIVPVGQGFNLTAATEQIETWTAKNEMDFIGNPVLAWNFNNVTLHYGISGHKYPSKGKSSNKIDGVSALCSAVEEYLRLEAELPAEESIIEIWN